MRNILRSGNVAGEKVLYKDGIGYCVWLIIDENDLDSGICIDFTDAEIDDLLQVVQQLKIAAVMMDVSDL